MAGLCGQIKKNLMFSNRPHFGLILGVRPPCTVPWITFAGQVLFWIWIAHVKVEVKSYKTAPFNFYELNLYHGEILVASGPRKPNSEIARARGQTEDFSSRGPTCDQNFTMIEVQFIKIEEGLFCSSWPLLSHELFRFRKALVLQKSFTEQCRGVRPSKSAQNGAYLKTRRFFLIWPHSPAINSFSDSELIFGFYAPKKPLRTTFQLILKKIGGLKFPRTRE